MYVCAYSKAITLLPFSVLTKRAFGIPNHMWVIRVDVVTSAPTNTTTTSTTTLTWPMA